MVKKAPKSFYLNVTLWSLFCLTLGLISVEINGVITNAGIREKETSVGQMIQTIRICQADYSNKNKGKFATFERLVKSGCLDGNKISGEQPVIGGYLFTLKVEEATTTKPAFYALNADPLEPENNARHFYFDSTLATVRATVENRPARAGDPAI